MKIKRIKRPVCYLVGLLAFGLMLYSCLQDETDLDSQETTGKVIKGKNRELSIDVARSWYEARQTPVVTTRSVVTHFELMTKLHWKKGYENRKGKFEVVEVPLLTRGGAVLMDRETIDRKSTRLNSVTLIHLVCRLLLEKKYLVYTYKGRRQI